MIKEKENLLSHKRHFCLGSFQLIGKSIFFHVRVVISIKQFDLDNLLIFLYSPAFVRLSQCLAILKTTF